MDETSSDLPDAPCAALKTQARNPLHGITLETLLTELVDHFDWSELGERTQIKNFNAGASISSGLKFLRATPWARAKVESLYLFMQREQARTMRAAAPPPPPKAAAFGTWKSPITADLLANQTLRLGQLFVMEDEVFWTESRPQEQGRSVLVWCDIAGRTADLTPAPLNVRSRVHEYGGGAYTLSPKAGFFINDADQQIWRIRGNEAPMQLTHETGKRFADLLIDPHQKRLICVCEDHTAQSAEAKTTLVSVKLSNGQVQELASGHDFYSSPTLSPSGKQLAWLSWNHPNMPWDGTQLWLCDVRSNGLLGAPTQVAGGDTESIFQPSWSPKGILHFVSDRNGWWNLHRLQGSEAQAVNPMEAEFGVAQWALGMSTYGFDKRGHIVCCYNQAGHSHLAILNTHPAAGAEAFKPIDTPFCAISELRVGHDFAVFIGSSETEPDAVIRLNLRTQQMQTLCSSSLATVPAACTSTAQAFSYPTEGGLEAHAFFYAPTNGAYFGLENERPPLIVISHGGPTGCTHAGFKWAIQYWTSRGFAVADVNYGGSTGYGRAYRARLAGQWGVVDVDDVINAARFLIERGDVDAERIVVRGSSAGGYTTLSALTFRSFFKAGASLYGIGDLEALARDTHKFESRYLDRLIGPLPASLALYRERSPVHHTERLACPMILFQGAEDKAVPPAQAKAMFDAVNSKGLPVAYLLFQGEQHGFRRPTTIRRVLEAELYFYGQVFGFKPADKLEAVDIKNLHSRD
jgi:dipeptidyl aminopeptidase/acylaminoacyl peptidase/uncharacterized protein (DUF2132 family)